MRCPDPIAPPPPVTGAVHWPQCPEMDGLNRYVFNGGISFPLVTPCQTFNYRHHSQSRYAIDTSFDPISRWWATSGIQRLMACLEWPAQNTSYVGRFCSPLILGQNEFSWGTWFRMISAVALRICSPGYSMTGQKERHKHTDGKEVPPIS